MLQEIIEVLLPLATKDRSARAYIQLLAGLQAAKADKGKILAELDQMEFYLDAIRTQIDEH